MVKINVNIPELKGELKDGFRIELGEITVNDKSYIIKKIEKVKWHKSELIGRRLLGGFLTAITFGLLYLFKPVKELFQKTKAINVTAVLNLRTKEPIPQPKKTKGSKSSESETPINVASKTVIEDQPGITSAHEAADSSFLSLPSELLSKIAARLPIKDLFHLQQTSKTMMESIAKKTIQDKEKEYVLSEAIEQCLVAIDSMNNGQAFDALLKMGEFLMPLDKDKALKIFERAKQKVKAERDYRNKCYDRSLVRAKLAISSSEEKISIANALIGDDQTFALAEISIDMAKVDVEKALEIAKGLQGWQYLYALTGIIKIIAPTNFELGLKLANEVAERAENLDSNREIIERIIDAFFAKYDRKRAFELADTIHPPRRGPAEMGSIKKGAYVSIAKEYAKSNLEEALEWANSLDYDTRMRVLVTIAKTIRSIDPIRALQITEETLRLVSLNENFFDTVKILCIETMALLDLEKALELVKEIESHSSKAEAFVGIILELIPINPEDAIKVACMTFKEGKSIPLYDDRRGSSDGHHVDNGLRFHIFLNLARAFAHF